MFRLIAVTALCLILNTHVHGQIKVVGPESGTVNSQYIIKVDEIKGSDLKIKYLKDGLPTDNQSADFIQLKDNDDKPVIVVFTRNPGVYTFIFASATPNGKVDICIHCLKITGNGPKPPPDPKPNPDPVPVSEYETKLTQLLINRDKNEVASLKRAWDKTDPNLYNTNLGFLNGLASNVKQELGENKLLDVRRLIGEYMKTNHANPSTYDLPKLKADWELTSKILSN
jgi:hypothetical protein